MGLQILPWQTLFVISTTSGKANLGVMRPMALTKNGPERHFYNVTAVCKRTAFFLLLYNSPESTLGLDTALRWAWRSGMRLYKRQNTSGSMVKG
jgi:hypothetical protein